MSSDDISIKSNNGKKINYSTDYMPEYLQNSDKLVVTEDRIKNNKNNDSYENDSYDSSVDNYITKSDNESRKGNKKSYNHTTDYDHKYTEKNSDKEEKEDTEPIDNYNSLSRDQKQKKRMEMMQLLGELVKLHNIKLSKSYNIDSDYFEMKNEYNLHKKIRDKEKTINWLSGILFSCVEGIEMWSEESGADNYNVKLSGWKDRMNASITDYYEVFGELYEKYNVIGKSYSPEIRLLFLIVGSATMTQLRNSRNMPAYSQIEKSNDDKLKQKMTREHDVVNNDLKDLEFLKQAKYKRDNQIDELERMKQNFMKTENEYKNTKTEEQRYSQINSQLQMLRNNITKLDNHKEQFPDYNKKTNNVIQNNKIDTDSSNSSSVKKEETKKSTYSRKSRKKANDLTINI
jgi:hypothetical protein